MSDIQTVSTATANAAATNTAAATSDSSASSAISSDFETFLLMLTTQLENQDPLNPVESQDFAVQLATFSGVEQQVRTNQLLEEMTGGFGNTGLAELAGWVGMEGRVAAPVFFDGMPIDLAIEPAAGATEAELIVYDAFGGQASRQSVPVANATLAWAGTDNNGVPLPPGSYTLQLVSKSGETVIATDEVAHYARIDEARQAANGVEIVIAGGTVVPSESVTALRDPASN